MEFRVGQISAKCPKCGATQFQIPREEHSGPRMNYVCVACGQASQYSKLISQIGRLALQKRKERLSGERADRVLADTRA
jgi:predicted nucleic-acid-binding Zn-ribbon protein